MIEQQRKSKEPRISKIRRLTSEKVDTSETMMRTVSFDTIFASKTERWTISSIIHRFDQVEKGKLSMVILCSASLLSTYGWKSRSIVDIHLFMQRRDFHTQLYIYLHMFSKANRAEHIRWRWTYSVRREGEQVSLLSNPMGSSGRKLEFLSSSYLSRRKHSDQNPKASSFECGNACTKRHIHEDVSSINNNFSLLSSSRSQQYRTFAHVRIPPSPPPSFPPPSPHHKK